MPKIIKDNNDYFPKGEIWLCFDQANGHPGTWQYVWWFRTKKEAKDFINEHIKDKNHYDISMPTRWKFCNDPTTAIIRSLRTSCGSSYNRKRCRTSSKRRIK